MQVALSRRTMRRPVAIRARSGTEDGSNLGPRDRCPVFQWMPTAAKISFEDVRDIYEICQEIPEERQREAIYLVHHLYGPGVEAYYPLVLLLKRCWDIPVSNKN